MQLTYPTEHSAGFAGMLYDLDYHMIESYASGEASAEMPFGVALKQKVAAGADELALMPAADTDEIIGILAHQHGYAKGGALPELGSVGVMPGGRLNVVRKGRLWVTVGATVTKGQRAYYQVSTKKWRASAVGGDTIDATKQAVFRSAGAADGIAVLEVNFVAKP